MLKTMSCQGKQGFPEGRALVCVMRPTPLRTQAGKGRRGEVKTSKSGKEKVNTEHQMSGRV